MTANDIIDWSQLGDDRRLRTRFICFYLALSWELYLDAEFVEERLAPMIDSAKLSAYERWVIELYREERTSLAEGQAAFARLRACIQRHEDGNRIREMLLSLVPEGKRPAAERHPLMGSFSVRRSVRNRLLGRRAWHGGTDGTKTAPPAVERETAFETFLEQPGFLESFEQYWHQPPKFRDNRCTRGLILCAAIFSMITPLAEADEETGPVKGRMQRRCHFSQETCDAIEDISHQLSPERLDPSWVARNFIADITETDRDTVSKIVRESTQDEQLDERYRQIAQRLWREFELIRG